MYESPEQIKNSVLVWAYLPLSFKGLFPSLNPELVP